MPSLLGGEPCSGQCAWHPQKKDEETDKLGHLGCDISLVTQLTNVCLFWALCPHSIIYFTLRLPAYMSACRCLFLAYH